MLLQGSERIIYVQINHLTFCKVLFNIELHIKLECKDSLDLQLLHGGDSEYVLEAQKERHTNEVIMEGTVGWVKG